MIFKIYKKAVITFILFLGFIGCSSGGDSPTPTPTLKPTPTPTPNPTSPVVVVDVPTPITGKTYYVDASVASSGNGLSEATAFKTLAEAANATAAGDGVLVKNGTYSNFIETTSGTASGWVVWRNFPGHKPKIVFTSWQGIYIKGSYVEIDGFTVQGNNDNITLADATNQPGGCNATGNVQSIFNGNGILVDSRTSSSNNPQGEFYHHINIKNCVIYDCGGCGIGGIQTDYIKIENCTVFDNSWYSIYGTSGISLLELKDFNTESSANRNVLRNNIVYNNKMLVPWRDGGCKFTDGNGIIIDYSNGTNYTGKTLIENNVVYNNGGRGIHVFNSSNVNIVNNTCYQNCSTADINEGEITIVGPSSTRPAVNCTVYNNIMFARTGERVNTARNTQNYIQNNNIYFNSSLGNFTTSDATVDPKFIDAAGGNFSLATDSRAIDYGSKAGYYPSKDILGVARFKGASVDCGAFEVK